MSSCFDFDTYSESLRTKLKKRYFEQKRIHRRYILITVIIPLIFFALTFTLDWILSGNESTAFIPEVFFWIALLPAAFIEIIFYFKARDASQEQQNLSWRIETLKTELSQSEETMAFASSGESFALFLRSFGAELKGIGDLATERISWSQSFRMGRLKCDVKLIIPDLSHIEANKRWHEELKILHVIEGAGFPVIMMGNKALSDEIRNDLASTSIRVLTIQAQDWWQIFLRICDRASVIFVYVREISPMLVKEMQHIHAKCFKYVLCGDDAEIGKLVNVRELGEGFLKDAMAIMGDDISGVISHLPGKI
jgi:hypothetical protein